MRKNEMEKANLYVDEVERQNYKLLTRVNYKMLLCEVAVDSDCMNHKKKWDEKANL